MDSLVKYSSPRRHVIAVTVSLGPDEATQVRTWLRNTPKAAAAVPWLVRGLHEGQAKRVPLTKLEAVVLGSAVDLDIVLADDFIHPNVREFLIHVTEPVRDDIPKHTAPPVCEGDPR